MDKKKKNTGKLYKEDNNTIEANNTQAEQELNINNRNSSQNHAVTRAKGKKGKQ